MYHPGAALAFIRSLLIDKIDEELTVGGATINPDNGKKAAERKQGL